MTDNITSIPRTQNEAWGFHGTTRVNGGNADRAWDDAMTKIAAATGHNLDEVRVFLDSRTGRHFADETHGSTIDAAVAKWMGWTISRRTSEHTGIPAGLPYLTGFVEHENILSNNEEAA